MKFSHFYIPFYYNFYSRLKWSIKKIVSWGIIYILPTFYIYQADTSFALSNIVIYVLAIIAIYSMYEIGYIQNDTETTKAETKPTLRLTKEDQLHYSQFKLHIYFFRFFTSIIAVVALLFFDNLLFNQVLCFGIGCLCILALYQIYNRIRNVWNIVIHFFLVVLRFTLFLVLAHRSWSWIDWTLLLFIFPIPNLIERGIESKFNFRVSHWLIKDQFSFAQFRIKYYGLLLMLLGGVYFFGNLGSAWILCLVLYYLTYRFTNLFMANTVSDNSKFEHQNLS